MEDISLLYEDIQWMFESAGMRVMIDEMESISDEEVYVYPSLIDLDNYNASSGTMTLDTYRDMLFELQKVFNSSSIDGIGLTVSILTEGHFGFSVRLEL